MSSTSKVRTTALKMLRGSPKPDKMEISTPSTSKPEMPEYIYDDVTMLPHLDEEDERTIAEWDQKYPSSPLGFSPITLLFVCIPKLYRRRLNHRVFSKKKKPFWGATLHILSVESVARLMRYGFDWTAANIVQKLQGQEEIESNVSSMDHLDIRTRKCKYLRTYKVCSLPGQVKWEGTLTIHAESRDLLLSFDVSEVTADTCVSVRAAVSLKPIYLASYKTGMKYNAIFKDKPLGKWWLPSGKRRSRYAKRMAAGWYDDSSSERLRTLTMMTAMSAAVML